MQCRQEGQPSLGPLGVQGWKVVRRGDSSGAQEEVSGEPVHGRHAAPDQPDVARCEALGHRAGDVSRVQVTLQRAVLLPWQREAWSGGQGRAQLIPGSAARRAWEPRGEWTVQWLLWLCRFKVCESELRVCTQDPSEEGEGARGKAVEPGGSSLQEHLGST